MKVLVTGAAGFIGGYIMAELRAQGHDPLGVDDYSRDAAKVPQPDVIRADVKDTGDLVRLMEGCDHVIAGAAMVGGIAYFHRLPYDLLAENDRIIASTCDAAIIARRQVTLGAPWPRKVTYLSSSMVFESAPPEFLPSEEGDELKIPPPVSSYGFQKLAVEYYARAAAQQYSLPFTILRPFNCAGVGEAPDMAHVIPELTRKVLRGDDPLHIYGDGSQLRHYTHGRDLARGIVGSLENPAALGEDFNLASPVGHTVQELAWMIWRRVHGRNLDMTLAHDPAFPHDVQTRRPDVEKAFRLLGWKAEIGMSEILDEVIGYLRDEKAT